MTDLQAAWQGFVDVAKKHWPNDSEPFIRLTPSLWAISIEVHGVDPRVVYDDDGVLNLENGITPDMWVKKTP